jgi:hypothetical protein
MCSGTSKGEISGSTIAEIWTFSSKLQFRMTSNFVPKLKISLQVP